MDLFEDLVDELKEDDLLEEALDVRKSDAQTEDDEPEQTEQTVSSLEGESLNGDVDVLEAVVMPLNDELNGTSEPSEVNEELRADDGISIDGSEAESKIDSLGESEEIASEDSVVEFQDEGSDVASLDLDPDMVTDEVDQIEEDDFDEAEIGTGPDDEDLEVAKEKYLQRVIDNVRSLQHVEYLISGVQREQMRERPEPYDTDRVKEVLHQFFEEFEVLNSPETTPGETALLKELENWHSALLERDKNMSVAHLRRYCETTKPPMDSEIVVSMARFYRNSPFSEEVRSKFDLVVTRLFSKDIGNEKRKVVFERDDLINHIKELYADWSSASLYEEDDENSDIILAAFKFEDYVAEAKKVGSFDELIKKGFFRRMKSLKKKTRENFFAPLLVATAVETNVEIGNRYIDLINEERNNNEAKSLGEKYGALHDKTVSEATSKSLKLVGLLKEKDENPAEEKSENSEAKKSGLFKWVLIGLIGVAIIGGALYASGIFNSPEAIDKKSASTAAETPKELGASSLKQYFLVSSTIDEKTLKGVVDSSWSDLPHNKKEETLQKLLKLGENLGYGLVELADSDGVSVGFASENTVNVLK